MRTTTPTLSDSSTVPLPAAQLAPEAIRQRNLLRLVVITPALVGFTLFYLLPTIRAFYIGLTNWNLLRAPKFLGLENYSRLLGDEKFWSSIWITVLYVVYNIPVQTVLGQLIAVLLKRLTGSVFVRSIMLAPFLISNVIAAMIWFWMLDPVLGFVNFILQAIGLGSHAFFSDEHLEKIDVLGKDKVNRY